MFSKNRRSIITAAVSILLAFGSAAIAQRQGSAGPVSFSLRSIDGQTVTSESLRGEVVVLAFGASWLPLTREQLQGIRKLADDYSARGVVVYFVATDSESSKSRNYASDEQLRAFAKKYGLKVTVLRDPDGAVAKRVGVDQLPAVVILNKQGEVAATIGGLDPGGNLASQLAGSLDKVLNQ